MFAFGLGRWTAIVAMSLWATLSGAVVAQDVPAVSGLRHGTYEDRVRLTLDIAPETAFSIFTLNEPDRLVIDFPALEWQVPPEMLKNIPYVETLRYGLFQRNRARLVAMLTAPVRVERAFTIPPGGSEPGRLVIDLAPVSRAIFDDTAGWPELARWRDGGPPAVPVEAEGRAVVVIDPGHGGPDPGATANGVTEKAVVLDFSKRLAAIINDHPDFVAVLTREKDEFVPLAERVARAHQARANLMISVHADTLLTGVARGFSIYTLSEKGTDDASEALARRENRADLLAGADLGGDSDDITQLLIELAQRGTSVESVKLAEAVILEVAEDVEVLRTKPHRQANFRVLKAPDIPSILLELGFLNSARDRERLTDPVWQDRAARAVMQGIERWTASASPGFLSPR